MSKLNIKISIVSLVSLIIIFCPFLIQKLMGSENLMPSQVWSMMKITSFLGILFFTSFTLHFFGKLEMLFENIMNFGMILFFPFCFPIILGLFIYFAIWGAVNLFNFIVFLAKWIFIKDVTFEFDDCGWYGRFLDNGFDLPLVQNVSVYQPWIEWLADLWNKLAGWQNENVAAPEYYLILMIASGLVVWGSFLMVFISAIKNKIFNS